MRFAEQTLKYIGAPYNPQGFKKSEGFDCFSTVIGFMREQGFDLPEDMTWKGLTFDSYYDLWRKSQGTAVEKMIEFFETFTERKPLKNLMPGDIMVVENKNSKVTFCSIYGGNDKIITSDMVYGVIALPLRHFNILEIFEGRKA